MENSKVICKKCGTENNNERYFCSNCGEFLFSELLKNKDITELPVFKLKRIMENLQYTPHVPILWNDTIDYYTKQVERFKAIYNIKDLDNNPKSAVVEKMNDFLELCRKADFQIAFVGTIKTGKSTLINALLGKNYASMAVTPETAALTKFRSSPKDYVKITFYTVNEWKALWKSVTGAAEAFRDEYKRLRADQIKDKWLNHKVIFKELANDQIEEELAKWSSSKNAEHYFVKEIEVGISNLPSDFPKQVVFVDTPGLSDPVIYRSEITKNYIRKANAVFVCVDAQKVYKEEIDTIASVFSFSSHNKEKVHIIATHWDNLNEPVQDWEKQKNYLIERLVGPAFFDNESIAAKNISYSSAYIYNLCREYDNLDQRTQRHVRNFAEDVGLGFKKDVREILSFVKDKTNIDSIYRDIRDQLINNYKAILYEDIDKIYKDIRLNLLRVSEDSKTQLEEYIATTELSLAEQNRKVEQQRANVKEIEQERKKLEDVLKLIEADTQKRISRIVALLDKRINAYNK